MIPLLRVKLLMWLGILATRCSGFLINPMLTSSLQPSPLFQRLSSLVAPGKETLPDHSALESPAKARAVLRQRRFRQSVSLKNDTRRKSRTSSFSQDSVDRNNNSTALATPASTPFSREGLREALDMDEDNSTLSGIPSGKRRGKHAAILSSCMEIPYNTTIRALREYHRQHGNLVIPRRFVVPFPDEETENDMNNNYPHEWYGHDLASTVYNMKWWQRHVKQRPHRVSELHQLGFVWERLQPEWNLVLEALIVYSTAYGHVRVPHKFVVPCHNDTWPKATWGIPLGSCVYRIRARHDFLRGPTAAARRDQLDGLGFVWWDRSEERFDEFVRVLRRYVTLQDAPRRALRVPYSFCVPQDSPDWPEDMWGYPLGERCHAVRQKKLYVKNHPDRRRVLDQLGFRWAGHSSSSWLEIMHAAAIYSKRNRGVLHVPSHFVVPREDHSEDVDGIMWPKHLQGLPLGQRLRDIRLKGAYLQGQQGRERRQQLDALGFVWSPPRGRPKKVQS